MAGFQESTSASGERTVQMVSRCALSKRQTVGMGCHSTRHLRWLTLADTATTAGPAADKAASNKEAKYRQLANSHIFVPVAIETVGTWNNQAVELVQELGRRITAVTEDTRETT